MATVETNIHGYHVELYSWEDLDGIRTSCFVTRGQYSASLAYLDDHGVLFDRDDRMKPVNPIIIDRITEWALENGY